MKRHRCAEYAFAFVAPAGSIVWAANGQIPPVFSERRDSSALSQRAGWTAGESTCVVLKLPPIYLWR